MILSVCAVTVFADDGELNTYWVLARDNNVDGWNADWNTTTNDIEPRPQFGETTDFTISIANWNVTEALDYIWFGIEDKYHTPNHAFEFTISDITIKVHW